MTRLLTITLLFLAIVATVRATDPLVVHEWGTFTSLQDEHGNALGRINTDDEPVPAFVHQLANSHLFPPTVAFNSDAKGFPEGDPTVTMRLETPVLYFHVPKSQATPIKLNVNVAFHGGWLTQFFPDTHAGIPDAANPFVELTSSTVGKLEWRDLLVNSNQGKSPETTDPVWTAPRAVDSAAVSVNNESEKFLFYRGVGQVDAPIRVIRNQNTLELQQPSIKPMKIKDCWFVDINRNGMIAFRKTRVGSITAGEFAAGDFTGKNHDALRADLHRALTEDGLFDDEADALLNTWDRSYFQNPGQRIFFLVPQSWTDAVLPLLISVPTQTNRVMMGRIELVSPAQRALLKRMSTEPVDRAAIKIATAAMTKLRNDPNQSAAYNALAGGHGDLHDLHVEIPQVYADFLSLGRFRTALVLDPANLSLMNLASAIAP